MKNKHRLNDDAAAMMASANHHHCHDGDDDCPAVTPRWHRQHHTWAVMGTLA